MGLDYYYCCGCLECHDETCFPNCEACEDPWYEKGITGIYCHKYVKRKIVEFRGKKYPVYMHKKCIKEYWIDSKLWDDDDKEEVLKYIKPIE